MIKASAKEAQDGEVRLDDAGPETRLGKLFALRQALANGTYKIPSGDVAEKLIEKMLHNR